MNLSTIKRYLGELLVKSKLNEEGIELISKGNQSGYDLEYSNIKIDVKLSCLKNEFKLKNRYWGWALKHQNKKKKVKATHFVCVALNDELEINAYYVIKANKIANFPKGIKQFSKVDHGLGVYSSDLSEINDKEVLQFFDNSRKLMQDKKFAIEIKSSDSISNVINKL